MVKIQDYDKGGVILFEVCCVKGEVLWDSLPTAKIVDYPLEKEDYKPYAQARVCMGKENFHLQMLSFEVEPDESSVLAAAFSFDPDEKKQIWLSSNRAGELVCKLINEEDKSEKDISRKIAARVFSGSDLQGIYWCVQVSLPLNVIDEYFSFPKIKPKDIIKGNFYKLCDGGARPHKGSFYPVNFLDKEAFGCKYFGDFLLVDY